MRRDVGPADLLPPAVDRVLPDAAAMMFRRTVYATSAAAAALLVGTLVWNLHQHAVDRGVRLLDRLRL